jgi:hypothetical protein
MSATPAASSCVTPVTPVLKPELLTARRRGRLLDFEADAERLVGGYRDVLVQLTGPTLVGVQSSGEVGAHPEAQLAGCRDLRRLHSTPRKR